jgi:hypothetical protein
MSKMYFFLFHCIFIVISTKVERIPSKPLLQTSSKGGLMSYLIDSKRANEVKKMSKTPVHFEFQLKKIWSLFHMIDLRPSFLYVWKSSKPVRECKLLKKERGQITLKITSLPWTPYYYLAHLLSIPLPMRYLQWR